MKNKTATGTLNYCAAILGLISLFSANLALAQSVLAPPLQTSTFTPAATSILAPSTTVNLDRAFTAEPPPPGTQPLTQETGTTGTAAGTSGTAGTVGTPPSTEETSETTQELDLPEPELPVLDIGMDNTSTTQTEEAVTQETTENCINPDSAKTTILSPVIGNQVKVALMALAGAILGALIWMLGSILISAARGRGEILRILNDTRQGLAEKRNTALHESISSLADALDGIIRPSGSKSAIDHDKYLAYRRAASDLEILGSEKSLDAHHQLSSLLSQPKPPSMEEFETARANLLQSLQNDILGKNDLPGQTGQSAS